MQNNRMIVVSVADTRKTKHWPRTGIFWSEFVVSCGFRSGVRRQWKNTLQCQRQSRMN